MEDRLQWLEEQNLAYGLVLGSLIQVIWPDPSDRVAARDVLGKMIERTLADGFGSVDYQHALEVLAELDGLFQMGTAISAAVQ